MLRDVFYFGKKPNVHPRERFAESLTDARDKATTEHFWIINEFCDYQGFDWDFDFEFLPDEDVWAEDHNNVWPSQHQKDSGTWLCPKEHSDVIIYRSDVSPVIRKNEKHDAWVLLEPIDELKFDFSWHPDPTSPPYIYKWGCKYFPAELKHYVEYHVPGATDVKYMDRVIELLPEEGRWVEHQPIDRDYFDMSWRPSPLDPPFIYVWGNKWVDGKLKPTLEYHAPGATDRKYMPDSLKVLPEWDRWKQIQDVDIKRASQEGFDFSWRPDPREPAYIYVWGNKWIDGELKATLEYHTPDAQDRKYMEEHVAVLPEWDRWEIIEPIDKSTFDFSWRPDPREPDLIYVFGNDQYDGNIMPTIEYRMPNAVDRKYINDPEFKAKLLPDPSKFEHLEDSYGIDYSWRPDPTSPPYIYAWGNQWNKPEDKISIQYVVPGATEYKYMEERATRKPCYDNWVTPDDVDETSFDYSWEPNPKAPPYVYEFGTQWQKTGGPCYVVEGATERKYIDDIRATKKPNMTNWTIPDNIDTSEFDFSWHSDATSPPYIYRFPTQWALSGGPVYTVPGATEVKYVDDQQARALPNKENWEYDPELVDEDDFDYSWHPYVEDEPYIYQFGTQWQKTGGHQYITPGVHKNSPVKYIDTRILHSKRLPNENNWEILNDYVIAEFDYSWHPDETEEPYIYQFGNNQYPAEEMPTIQYKVKGAKQVKYVNEIVAKLGVDMKHWEVPNDLDVTEFDFSWHPYVEDEPFIYQFGTQWQKTGGPRYVVPGATKIKYVDTRIIKATRLPNPGAFTELGYKIKEFDYSWHPDSTEKPYIYVFGNNQYSAEEMPTIEYRVAGATQKKYVKTEVAVLDEDKTHWEIPDNLNVDNFDFSWKPHPKAPAYIYEFGTQWQKTGGPRYVVPGAKEVKYVAGSTAIRNADKKDNNWHTLDYKVKDFDYSWHPDNTEEPYIYVFGNTQYPAEEMPTVEYRVPGATQKKYINDPVAKLAPTKENWEITEEINKSSFDFSWTPHPKAPPYIYVFGNTQYPAEEMPTVRYVVPGATQIKYVHDLVAELASNKKNWEIPNDIDVNSFDFSWVPHPKAPPYIYQFGTQWQKTGGPRYVMPGATDIKYIDTQVAQRLPSKTNWNIPKDVDVSKFDFSWHPDATADPAIYQFGSLPGQDDGPRYIVPDNNGTVLYLENVELDINVPSEVPRYVIETTLEDLIDKHKNEVFWAINKDLDYSNFDFGWRPDVYQSNYIHAFGSKENIDTQTYFVNSVIWEKGFKNINYVETDSIQIKADLDMFFVDRGNTESQERYNELKSRYPKLQKTRYLNSWADTILRCTNRATSNLIWVLNSELDYAEFDFDYYPNPWQMKMVHVFGTQWSHWGTTYLVNREQFPEDTKYIKIVEHLSNLNFVKSIRAKATKCVYDIVVIDHGNPELETVVDQLKEKAGDRSVSVVKYDTSYLNTLRTIISKQQEKKEHYIWLCSSICDYSDFDFSYICDPFAKDQLHVFPSDTQKFGDTFFVDVNKAKEILEDMTVLEDFHKVNYNATMRVKRLPAPEISTSEDSLIQAAQSITDWPYALVTTSDNMDLDEVYVDPISLWEPESKNIVVTSIGATRAIIPREAKDYVKKELYDYPYIKKSSRLAISKPMDIVFLSNGEAGAEENWEHLQKITKGIKNRVVRVDGVNGRVAAYHAAAEASNTPWAFTVFAKLKVSPKFDWNWQPDRLQVPKHYIFQAKNPVNGLIYGHQAMIAYNKKLTLANEGKGLDFTLDDEHEVVGILSGTAVYNTDPFSTWRTAFREVIKLRAEDSSESNQRLDAWLNKAEGDFAEFSIKGALDADEYYDEVDGDFEKIKLSYEWAWLQQRFNEL